jgi:hypothetical protein
MRRWPPGPLQIDDTARRLFLSAILALWDRGMDTDQIARTLRNDEGTIERGLHEALALRKREAPCKSD